MKLDFDSLYNECKRDVFAAGKEVFYDDAVKRLLKQDDCRDIILREMGGKIRTPQQQYISKFRIALLCQRKKLIVNLETALLFLL